MDAIVDGKGSRRGCQTTREALSLRKRLTTDDNCSFGQSAGAVRGAVRLHMSHRGVPSRKAGAQEADVLDMIKVSARSRSTSVAGAIAGVVREKRRADVQAIGAGAVNQAVKAVAIARGYLALDGIDVICIPEFSEVEIDGQERTAVKMIVEPR